MYGNVREFSNEDDIEGLNDKVQYYEQCINLLLDMKYIACRYNVNGKSTKLNGGSMVQCW